VSDLDQAYALFRRAARELEQAGGLTADEMRRRLRGISRRILDLLDDEEDDPGDDDVFTRLQRDSDDIAEDLRRVDDLMRRRREGEL